MTSFISGALMMGYVVAALFFLRFWRRTSDRFFLAFAVAFILLAVQRTVLAATGASVEDARSLYLLRFAAFAVILLAIVAKNRHPPR